MIFHHVTPSQVSAPFRYPSWVEVGLYLLGRLSVWIESLDMNRVVVDIHSADREGNSFLSIFHSCSWLMPFPGLCLPIHATCTKTPVHNDVAGSIRCMTDINCERRRTKGACLGRHRDSTPRP
ncbi:hypothetical protein B0T13DRAFT_498294 [Neurospora crassa]|nr:hypothetical protein B0T13DRAFT_498294 [Neurospora crassa]